MLLDVILVDFSLISLWMSFFCHESLGLEAPLHQLRLDAYAQSVIDSTAANVREVLIADSGKFEVFATDDQALDSSDEEVTQQGRTSYTVLYIVLE